MNGEVGRGVTTQGGGGADIRARSAAVSIGGVGGADEVDEIGGVGGGVDDAMVDDNGNDEKSVKKLRCFHCYVLNFQLDDKSDNRAGVQLFSLLAKWEKMMHSTIAHHKAHI